MPSANAWILHLDLDQFVAAVEVRRHPELRGRPVVVGGNGDATQARQVVSTASYEAREFGVHSGMPLRLAARKCPDAVFLPTDRAAYEAASSEVMAVLRRFGSALEVWGWDEAFIAVETDDPEATARALQRAVHDETGLHCSVGIGDTKLRAKLAAGFGKPAGVYRLTAANWWTVMGGRPVTALWGIGRRTGARLAERKLDTVDELARADPTTLAEAFGPRIGPWLIMLARGGGHDPVRAEPWLARSRSRETTFATDLVDRTAVEQAVRELARQAAADAFAEGRPAVRVAVKVRFAPFFTQTKISKLPTPTREPGEIEQAAVTILDRFERDRPVRLLGVRVELAASEPARPEPAAPEPAAREALSVDEPSEPQVGESLL